MAGKKRRGAPRGNKNARIGERTSGFTMRIKTGYADMLYAALLSAGNASPSQHDLAEAVEYALRQCYERQAENQHVEEMML